jgi:integrase
LQFDKLFPFYKRFLRYFVGNMNSQEKRFVRVAEGVYRYRTGGFYARGSVNGKPTWQKLKSADLPTAKREAREVLRSLERLDRQATRKTLGSFADAILDASRGMVPRAFKNKERVVALIKERWPRGADIPINKVRTPDIRAFVASVAADAGSSYRNFVLGMVKSCFQMALEDRAILEIPGTHERPEHSVWKRSKPAKPVRLVPTVEQFRAIVESIRKQEFAGMREETADFVEAEGVLGLGQSELANLRWRDVNFETGTIQVLRIKTQKPFSIPLYPQAQPLLERRRDITGSKPENRVFTIKDGKVALATACRRLKFPAFSQRSFRRMFVTEALRKGVSVKILADLQGHTDGGKLILQTYSDVISEKDRAEAGRRIAEAFLK